MFAHRVPRRRGRDPDLRLLRPHRRLGPLATYAEPHTYDLCSEHAERLTAPAAGRSCALAGEYAEPAARRTDDLLALADAVREAGRPRATEHRRPSRRRRAGAPRRGRGRPPGAVRDPAAADTCASCADLLTPLGCSAVTAHPAADFIKAYDVRGRRARPAQRRRRRGPRRRVRPGRRRSPSRRRQCRHRPRHAPLLARAVRGPSPTASPRAASTSRSSASAAPTGSTTPAAPSTCPARCSPRATTRRSTTASSCAAPAPRPVGQDTGLAEVRDLGQAMLDGGTRPRPPRAPRPAP